MDTLRKCGSSWEVEKDTDCKENVKSTWWTELQAGWRGEYLHVERKEDIFTSSREWNWVQGIIGEDLWTVIKEGGNGLNKIFWQ